jgi:hypothetical protein
MNGIVQQAAKKAKAHTAYFVDAVRVPGVTTITGVLDKPALVRWANNLGLQGIDSFKYVDELAVYGTLAHYMIECHLKGEPECLDDFSKTQIDIAQNGAIRFLQWQEQVGFLPLFSEKALTSQAHMFGGTIDAYGETRDGKRILCDIKTCKGVFPEHKTQVGGGYDILLQENGYRVDEIHIIRVGRTESEGFDDVLISNEERAIHARRFLLCRELYEVNKLCK